MRLSKLAVFSGEGRFIRIAWVKNQSQKKKVVAAGGFEPPTKGL
jgi:hypothetical protein